MYINTVLYSCFLEMYEFGTVSLLRLDRWWDPGFSLLKEEVTDKQTEKARMIPIVLN